MTEDETNTMTTQLPEPLRMTIFADLVAAQDAGATVPDSRYTTAKKHGIDVDAVRRIEREGLDGEWEPLG